MQRKLFLLIGISLASLLIGLTVGLVRAQIAPPNAPSNLHTTSVSSNSVRLTWSDNATTEDKFNIEREVAATTTWITLAQVGTNVTTYTDTSIATGITYNYRVQACLSGSGCSEYTYAMAVSINTAVPTCTGLTLVLDKQNYTAGDDVDYIWTCTPGGAASFVIIQLVKPDSSVTTYNSFNGSSSTQSLGFGTSNLAPGSYVLRACFTSSCAPVTASAPFTVSAGASTAPMSPNTASVTQANGYLQVSWPTVSGATHYSIERSVNGGTYTGLASGFIQPYYGDTTVTSGSVYRYRVHSCKSGVGCSSAGTETSSITYTVTSSGGSDGIPPAPGMPVGVASATVGTSQNYTVMLYDQMSAGTRRNLQERAIFDWGDGTTGETSLILPDTAGTISPALSHSWSSPGSYTIRAKARSSGGAESGWSGTLTVTVQNAASNPTLSTVPSAPSDLRINQTSTSSAVYLKWNDNAQTEDKFNLERKLSTASAWSALTLLPAQNITTYTDTSVTSGTTYDYRVQACLSGTGCSSYATLSNVLVPSTQANSLPAPSSLVAQVTSSGAVQLSWNYTGSSGSSFKLYRRLSIASVWPDVPLATTLVHAYADTTALSDASYSYKVVAFAGTVLSPDSNIVTVAVLAATNHAAPKVINLTVLQSRLEVTFDQTLETASAGALANYSLESPVGTQIDLHETQLQYTAGSTKVTLAGLSLLPGATFKLGLAGVRGSNGMAIAPGTQLQGTVQTSSSGITLAGWVYEDRNANGQIDSNEGLANAGVNVSGTSQAGQTVNLRRLTGADGSYSLVVPAGTAYHFWVSHPSSNSIVAEQVLSLTANLRRDVALRTTIQVAVQLTSGGAAFVVPQGVIDFTSEAGAKVQLTLVSSAGGSVSLFPGVYAVRVGVPGIAPESVTISGSGVSAGKLNVTATASPNLTIELPSKRRLKISVTAQGQPLAGAAVALNREGAAVTGITGTDGTVSYDVAEGEYAVRVQALGYQEYRTTVHTQVEPQLTHVPLQAALAILKGRVVVGGLARAGALVRASTAEGASHVSFNTDSNGSYLLKLAPGTWQVSAVVDGYEASGVSTVMVNATTSTILDFSLTTPLVLETPHVEDVPMATGAVVSSANLGARVTVPPATVAGTTVRVELSETNQITATSSAAPLGGRATEVNMTTATGGAAHQLANPVIIELNYSLEDLVALGASSDAAGNLKLAYWDEVSRSWVMLPCVVDTTTKVVRASVSHLTLFAIVLPFAAKPALAQTTDTFTQPQLPEAGAAQDTRAAQFAKLVAEGTQVYMLTAEGVAQAANLAHDSALESTSASKYIKPELGELTVLVKNRIVNFITYGTSSTRRLGAGERAGVVYSFRAAYEHAPESEYDWQEVLKIANGRFPGQISTAREQAMAVNFKQVYGREPVQKNPNDSAAIAIMAYGLRTTTRSFISERAALTTFRAVYKRTPANAADWDLVRAIAYSGAKR